MPAGRRKALDVDAAMQLVTHVFWRDGHDGVTLDQIASELGVTKPTLCRTLGDKDAMFAAALDTYHREHIAPAETAFVRGGTLREALATALLLFAERTLSDDLPDGCFMGDASAVGDAESGPIAETLARLQGTLVASVSAAIERAIVSGELEPGTESAAVLHYILGQVAAVSAISRSHPSRTQIESVVGFMLDGLPWVSPAGNRPTAPPHQEQP